MVVLVGLCNSVGHGTRGARGKAARAGTRLAAHVVVLAAVVVGVPVEGLNGLAEGVERGREKHQERQRQETEASESGFKVLFCGRSVEWY